jgi:hypothetical protein
MTDKKVKGENKVLSVCLIIALSLLVIIGIFIFRPYQKSSKFSSSCPSIDSIHHQKSPSFSGGCPKDPCTDSITILSKNNSLNYSLKDVKEHNLTLISTLQERETSERDSWEYRQNNLNQVHAIYFGILVVILSLILKGETRGKIRLYLLPLVLIIMMYGVTVHHQDLNCRSNIQYVKTRQAVEKLAYSIPNDSTWYTLNYTELHDSISSLHLKRFRRKFQIAYHPQMEQIVFYIVPFILIAAYLLFFGNLVNTIWKICKEAWFKAREKKVRRT